MPLLPNLFLMHQMNADVCLRHTGRCRGDEECADKSSDIRRELAHVRMDGGLDALSDRTHEHEARRAECEWHDDAHTNPD